MILVVQTVLQQHDLGIRLARRSNDLAKVIGSGFCANKDPVALGHVCRILVGLYRMQVESWVDQTVDGDALFLYRVKLTAQQEVHVITAVGQHRAIKPANGAGANDPYLQITLTHTTLIWMMCYWYIAMVIASSVRRQSTTRQTCDRMTHHSAERQFILFFRAIACWRGSLRRQA